MPAIQVSELVKDYGTVRAVDGISFTVHEGAIFGLLGPNGAGKTTTMEILAILGMGTFFSLGFFLAGIAKDAEAVVPLVNLVSLPMMFLSGIFFPVDSLPRWLLKIVHYLPLRYLADGLRSTLTSGVKLTALGTDVAGLGAWMLVAIVASIRVFRWE